MVGSLESSGKCLIPTTMNIKGSKRLYKTFDQVLNL